MIQLLLSNVSIKVGVRGDRNRVLTAVDEKSGIEISLLIDPFAAIKIGNELASSQAVNGDENA